MSASSKQSLLFVLAPATINLIIKRYSAQDLGRNVLFISMSLVLALPRHVEIIASADVERDE